MINPFEDRHAGLIHQIIARDCRTPTKSIAEFLAFRAGIVAALEVLQGHVDLPCDLDNPHKKKSAELVLFKPVKP